MSEGSAVFVDFPSQSGASREVDYHYERVVVRHVVTR
jgi:hypothetical protein